MAPVERRHGSRRTPDDQPVTGREFYEALDAHAEIEREYVRSLCDEVMTAFPDGTDNHRRYHEVRIKAAKAEEEFWHTAKEQLIKAGVNGLVTLVKVIIVLAALGLTVKFTMPESFAKLILGTFAK